MTDDIFASVYNVNDLQVRVFAFTSFLNTMLC